MDAKEKSQKDGFWNSIFKKSEEHLVVQRKIEVTNIKGRLTKDEKENLNRTFNKIKHNNVSMI